jgi:DNA-binding Lrp family transcriptional regulator
MERLDETDTKILAELANDARATYADIGERVNLGYQNPEVLIRLKGALKAWEDEMDATEREILVR